MPASSGLKTGINSSPLERGLVGTGRIQSLSSYVQVDELSYFKTNCCISGLLRLTLFILNTQ